MSRKDNKYGYSSFTEEELRKYIKLLGIPFIIILLVVIIIFAERRANGPEEESQTFAEVVQSEAETAESEIVLAEESESAAGETESISDLETEGQAFLKDEVPEVNALLESYFTAKQAADVETVYQLFGRTDTEGMEELRSEYSYTSRYTDGYENIVCYTKPGPADGSYLVYVSYDLKFKSVETLAPGLFRVYVVTGADGNLQLVDTSQLAPEIQQLFDDAEKTDELILLRTQVYAKLRQALETDPDLAGIYGVLQKNSQFTEEETREDSNVSILNEDGSALQITTETEAAESTETEAADTESGETAASSESAETEAESSQGEETETTAG
mgnify:FL=1